MEKILGIDPGLRRTGWGVIEKKDDKTLSYVDMGIISTTSKDDLSIRLFTIFQKVQEVARQHMPVAAAIEETYVNTNYNTSLQLAQAKAAAILAMCETQITPAQYPATTVKKTISGSGNADKQQVLKMLKIWLPNFNYPHRSLDASDAIALAVCYAKFKL